jgi:hypothetical protein
MGNASALNMAYLPGENEGKNQRREPIIYFTPTLFNPAEAMVLSPDQIYLILKVFLLLLIRKKEVLRKQQHK